MGKCVLKMPILKIELQSPLIQGDERTKSYFPNRQTLYDLTTGA